MTREQIIEKNYANHTKRIAYPEKVYDAMDEYAKQEAISFNIFIQSNFYEIAFDKYGKIELQWAQGMPNIPTYTTEDLFTLYLNSK